MGVFIRLFWIVIAFNSYADEVTPPSLNQLNYYTEEYPPYNFTANGRLQGIAVDYLVYASQQANSVITIDDISVQPWPRAYRNAIIRPNTVLFSTTRTKIRDPLFKWAGPIGVTRVVVLAKRSKNIEIHTDKELAQYRIGAVRDDVGEQLLLELGVPRDSIADNSVPDTLANQLAKNRIDLWAYEENVARWWLRKAGFNNEDFEVVYVLSEGELFYAFSKDVPDEIVNQLQQGLDRVRSEKSDQGVALYSEILARYQ